MDALRPLLEAQGINPDNLVYAQEMTNAAKVAMEGADALLKECREEELPSLATYLRMVEGALTQGQGGPYFDALAGGIRTVRNAVEEHLQQR